MRCVRRSHIALNIKQRMAECATNDSKEASLDMGHGCHGTAMEVVVSGEIPMAGLGHQPTVLEHPKATGRGTHPAMAPVLLSLPPKPHSRKKLNSSSHFLPEFFESFF